MINISPTARLTTNALEVQRAAVAAGLGIAFTFEGFYADLLSDGRVVEALSDWSMPFSGPFLFYHDRRYVPAPRKAFVDFLMTERA